MITTVAVTSLTSHAGLQPFQSSRTLRKEVESTSNNLTPLFPPASLFRRPGSVYCFSTYSSERTSHPSPVTGARHVLLLLVARSIALLALDRFASIKTLLWHEDCAQPGTATVYPGTFQALKKSKALFTLTTKGGWPATATTTATATATHRSRRMTSASS
jgi:hypothetical protein